jgi:hypothetical protein
MEREMNKPNGPVAAALLAGGIGSTVLGLATFVNEINTASAFSKSLVWVRPVGGLSGKSSLAIIAFLAAWIILGFVWRGREVNFKAVSALAFVFLAIGLIGTFPPVWHIFAPE